MKNLTRFFCSFWILCLATFQVKAQSNDVDLFVEDMLFLADGFASPAAESAAYQASAGWFSSAMAIEKWSVDVSLHGNALIVPSSKKEFTVNNNDFNILRIQDGGNAAILPTAFGANTDIQFEGEVEFAGQTFPIQNFDAIDGIDRGALIYPFAQVRVGLPYETEIAVRVLPELEVDGSKFNTYGIGIKHNLSQYFKFNDEEDLQFALAGSYSLFNVKYEFEPVAVPGIVTLNLIDVDAKVWMAEGLASKRYENFEIFGALGVAQSSFDYEFDGSGLGLSPINTALLELSDQQLQFKGDVGFNLYFNKFKITTMATAGKFVNINLGLHFIL